MQIVLRVLKNEKVINYLKNKSAIDQENLKVANDSK